VALLDWLETRLYARRLRRSLARERAELLRQVFGKRPAAPGDPDPASEPEHEDDE
jgi:hypothetical protein